MDLLFTFIPFFIIVCQIGDYRRVKNDSIFKPDPLPGFSHRNLIVLPADVPSRIMYNALSQGADRTQKLLFSRLFYFKDRVVLYGGVGAPALILALEPLLVSGIDQIVFLGLAGSLTPRLKLQSAVIVDSALSEEGTSRHYFPGKKVFEPSPALRSHILSFLKRIQLPCLSASAVSMDSPYRETREWISRQIARGCEMVDMEISSVFALAEYYRIQASAIMIISDQLSHEGHEMHFHKLDDAVRTYFFPIIKKENKIFLNNQDNS
jgi:purine-nucleoside phosphorylase